MNWGFIGYGGIAPQFLQSLIHVPGQHAYAIASKSNYERIKSEFPDTKAYVSYADLLADPMVEVVYISTTHNFHLQNTLDALQAGKHVLCEKPLGVNLQEYEQMIQAAEKAGVFFMEAIWTRFLPAYQEAMKLLEQGVIGTPELVIADFGIKPDVPDDGRLFNPELAGGSVLDVGIYPISFALDVFKEKPSEVKSCIRRYHTGVDASASILLEFGDHHANLFSSVVTATAHDGVIYGTEGKLYLPHFFHPNELHIIKDGQVETRHLPYEHTGYYHEIEETIRCIAEGRTQSRRVSWKDSLLIAQTMDRVLS